MVSDSQGIYKVELSIIQLGYNSFRKVTSLEKSASLCVSPKVCHYILT